ncbi:ParA family protein, partial [Cribrihabitans sp. XS_ASV171]
DCPPNISALSENVFKAADRIIVPVIPTTLSARTFEQLIEFFDEHGLRRRKLAPFFSMVETRKSLHMDTMKEMRTRYRKLFLQTTVPYSADIERMGLHRAPVRSYAAKRPGGRAYAALYDEVSGKGMK